MGKIDEQHFHFMESYYAKQQINDLVWKNWSLDSLLFVYSITEKNYEIYLLEFNWIQF